MIEAKALVKRLLGNRGWGIVRSFLEDFGLLYGYTAYSQEGEDCVLRKIFEGQTTGFYVDVGAFHPMRFSNTCIFYKMGWRGINIDAMPGSMKKFNRLRPRDINLEIGIARERGKLDYFIFNDPALNGFQKEVSEFRNGLENFQIREVKQVETMPLAEVLVQHLPKGTEIDFLTVDAEGIDFDVLCSNDWSLFRPKVVLVEILGSSLDEIEGNPLSSFLREKGYKVFAKTENTVFFLRDDFLARKRVL